MKVLRYELVNFGSHRHTILEPGSARFVVVTGANGLGKTTLVSEALGYALYRDFRGSVNGPVRIGQTDASVTVEFEFAGDVYRAFRRRTTRAAGQTSADLQRRGQDGRWTKVASGDKEVPAAIRELFRMDAGTFRASVSLAQRDLGRFVAATSGERHAILSEIVVDPRFAPAATIAGRRALTLERDLESSRSTFDNLGDAIAELEPTRDVLEAARAEVAAGERAATAGRDARDAAAARIRTVDEQLALASAVIGEQLGLTAERDELYAAWGRMEERRKRSVDAIREAEAVLLDAPAVEAAAAELEEARASVAALVADEGRDRKLAGEIAEASRALEEIDRPLRAAVTTWRTKRSLEETRIRELEEHARAGTSTCATCGQPIEERQAIEQLAAARQRLRDLGDEPKAPLALARASAAVQRLEMRRRELGWDPAAMVDARDRLTALERLAARAEGLEAARGVVTRETAAIAEADADAVRIRTRGRAVNARLEELNSQAATADELRTERATLDQVVADADAAIATAERQRREAEARAARSEANVERLEQLIGEREDIATRIADLRIRVERLRKVGAAFGLRGIPARMIESVLPELGRHANDALSGLFGMSLELRAQRASADGKSTIEALDIVVRKDEAGEHELARISGGQGTAVSLALAIGLSRLNARRAGTAIRTLVIDEPEGLDAVRLGALGAYLRDLLFRGELDRVFLVTHTSELAEYADQVVELREGADGPEIFIDGIRSQPDELAAAAA